jgi:DNA-binding response OmpR family regulator
MSARRGRGDVADLLLVDDDRDLSELLAALLEAAGHVVRVAYDGEEGFLRVGERHPELVLLDVEMPRLTGPEMSTRMFVHDVGLEKIPIVLLSGVTNLEAIARLVGTPYFLAKPYAIEAVLLMIATAARERRAPVPAPA